MTIDHYPLSFVHGFIIPINGNFSYRESKLLVQQHSVALFSPAGAAFAQGHSDFLTSKNNVMDTRYFVTSKYAMIKELLRSAGNGNALGIWSSTLGNGMFLCFVKEVWRDDDEEDVVVILRDNELTGVELETHVLYLREIERICSFNSSHSVAREVHSSQ